MKKIWKELKLVLNVLLKHLRVNGNQAGGTVQAEDAADDWIQILRR